LLHKESGARAGKSCPRSGNAEILTRAAATDDIHRRQRRSVQLRNVSDLKHVGEAYLRYLDGKGFNLACPYGRDAIADC